MQQVLIFVLFSFSCTTLCYTFNKDQKIIKSWYDKRDSRVDGDGTSEENLGGLKYNEYPTVVPRKRTAIFLDRVMMALQKAIDEEEKAAMQAASIMAANKINSKNSGPDALRSMDLQRRGRQDSLQTNQKGRVYWRCYFNAITCFK